MVIEYLEQVATLKRIWNIAPLLQIVQKILENYCPGLYQSIGVLISCGSKDLLENAPCPMYTHHTHHDVTDLVNYEIVKNENTLIF